MISHLTPGFAKAGLYTQVAELNELITNFLMLDEGQTKQNTQSQIVNLADELNILTDLSLSPDDLSTDFSAAVVRIQDHLNTLAQMSQPLGIHIFGKLPKEQHLYSTILQMLGDEYTQNAAKFEKQYDLAIQADKQKDKRNVVHIEALENYQIQQRIITQDTNKADAVLTALPEKLALQLNNAKTYWDNFHKIGELSGLINALNGQILYRSEEHTSELQSPVPISYGVFCLTNKRSTKTTGQGTQCME